jgi:phosphoglycolate phosphatase
MQDSSIARLQAILFDFDGTLADSYAAITASVNHVRAHHCLPPLAESEVRRHVGRGPEYLLQHTVADVKLPEDLFRYRQHHPSVMFTGTRLLPGALQALSTAKDRGLKVGVCSNKPRAFTKELLEYLDIGRYIDAAFGPEDVVRPKPAPDMLRKALKWLGVEAENTLYIGDMVVDILTGLGADVRVWTVPTGSDDVDTLETAGPERMLRDLFELATLLQVP